MEPTNTFSLVAPFQEVLGGIVGVLPEIVLAIIFLIIGMLAGWLLRHAIVELFKVLRIDALLAKTDLEHVIKRAGYKLNTGKFVGELARWIAIIIFVFLAFDILPGFEQVTDFIRQDLLEILLSIIIAVIVLFIGAIVGEYLKKFVRGTVDATGFGYGNVLGTISQVIVWIFVIDVALSQFGFKFEAASFYFQTTFAAFIFMIALGLAIAFGMGGRDMAQKALQGLKKGKKK